MGSGSAGRTGVCAFVGGPGTCSLGGGHHTQNYRRGPGLRRTLNCLRSNTFAGHGRRPRHLYWKRRWLGLLDCSGCCIRSRDGVV